MIFRPCFVIPIYNHKDTIDAMVARLVPYGLPIFIVDDGSDVATRDTLTAIASREPSVRLLRFPLNCGKGAAVMHGLQEAHAAGFSHALQIDADGQHDTADVPKFLERGRGKPSAVICGAPVYDSSAPKSRRYGRYITHFWVWVETLAFDIQDSMCGFRLYPLAATCALINRARIPTRMDFDIGIIVRLAWQGLPIENVTTRVVYPKGGLSHFHALRDNLRISRTHAWLTCGMLARLPLLLWRKLARPMTFADDHWSHLVERGNSLGLAFVSLGYRILGYRIAKLLLYPAVVYFFVTGTASRRASFDYFRRLFMFAGGTTPRPGWKTSFRHMLAFAESGLDKLAAWLGRLNHEQVAFPERTAFDHILASGRGAVLLGAHLGNLEMTRALAHERGLKGINAVVYTDHALQFAAALKKASAKFPIDLIQVSEVGPDTVIRLREKIEQGELVVIVGDRTPPAQNDRIVSVDFLGKPAAFPLGPFLLASLLECPVYLFFCLKTENGYCIHLEPFSERIELKRRERQQQLAAYIERYARRLEAYCVLAPYQWFNFFDFWRETPRLHT